METIFDLPAHPLFVHAPLVLAPLVAASSLAIAARPGWRRRYGVVIAGASVVVFVMTLMAKFSGEELFQLLREEPSIARHEDLANQSTIAWFVFMVAVVSFVGLGHFSDRRSPALAGGVTEPVAATPFRAALVALAVVVSVFGVFSTVWMLRTGHEGAKSHWSFINQDG